MRAFVTGATGFVGWHLARRLLDRGARVRCLIRGEERRRDLEPLDVDVAVGDLRDEQAVLRAVAGSDVVFHCAADYRLFVPDPQAMYAANVEGTRNVLSAASAHRVDRVVYTSTVGALGLAEEDRPADEQVPVTIEQMTGHYKRSKFLAERVAEEWADKGLPVVIVNPSAPVGERDIKPTATGQMIVDFLRGKMRAYVDTGLNLIDVRDVAEGHVLAAEKGLPGQKYILGHRDMTLREILETLARLTCTRAPRVKLPHWVPLAAASLETQLARWRGREPRLALDAVRLSKHKMFFDAGKAVSELGLPQTPIEEALRRAIDWFHGAGYVTRTVA